VIHSLRSNDERFGGKVFSIAAVIETTKCEVDPGYWTVS
jgi:hypothetical protein